jgi:hypothetical protein
MRLVESERKRVSERVEKEGGREERERERERERDVSDEFES